MVCFPAWRRGARLVPEERGGLQFAAEVFETEFDRAFTVVGIATLQFFQICFGVAIPLARDIGLVGGRKLVAFLDHAIGIQIKIIRPRGKGSGCGQKAETNCGQAQTCSTFHEGRI